MHSEGDSEVMATTDVVASGGRLTDNYANAWSDFYPSRAGCVYKSGPAWKVRHGPEEQGIVRQARAVCRPDIAPKWVSILQKIIACLDSMGVDLTCINPFGWANEGEEEPFCPFLLSVGVMPYSLAYGVAVVAAARVKEILAASGLAEVEVAFVEMVVKRSAGGPKLLPLDRTAEVPEYRKHFSSALGLPIAPLDTAYYEGTGALYFRLSSENKDIALLTCAHVALPPPKFPDNKGMTRTNNSQPKELIVALGSGGYKRAVAGMVTEIAKLTRDIDTWRDQLGHTPAAYARKRRELTIEVDKATHRISQLDEFHTEATTFRFTPELRTVGWVLHSSPIQVSAQPIGYTEDWALIQLDPKMIDEETFVGNKVFFGDKFTPGDFAELMYPHREDRANYRILNDSLLQAFGIVTAAEISNPLHLEANGQRCLIVMKNGGTTNTTIGRANGLESVKRTYPEHGIVKQDSLEIAVVYYGKGHGRFSDTGDSGSIVLTRDGKILGMLTGGAGPTTETDVTWLTPFHYLMEQIKNKFPDAFIYDIKN